MNINAAVIGEPSFAAQFGKKGTDSDVTFYNFRRGEDTITFIHPSRYPERLSSLLFTLELADMAILQISTIDPVLGEIVVAVHSMNITRGYIYLGNYLQAEQVSPLLLGTTLEEFEIVENKPPELRERILDLGNTHISDPDTGEHPIVPIDHHFHVRGIGAVALGVVRNGIVRKYDKLKLFPSGQDLLVRSIQTHDKDVAEAVTGERVGLALKGPTVDELDRGHIIAHVDSGVRSSTVLRLELSIVPYWKKDISMEMVVHLSSMMQMRPGRITRMGSDDDSPLEEEATDTQDGNEKRHNITVEMERPFTYHPDIAIIVSHFEAGPLRIIGPARPLEE